MPDNTKYNLYYVGSNFDRAKLLGENIGKATNEFKKKAVVNTAIKHYIKKHPDETYQQLQQIFNKPEIRKDLILDEDDRAKLVQEKKPINDKIEKIHGKILVNGTTYYISNQFGDDPINNFKPFVQLIEQLGYIVEEADQNNSTSPTIKNIMLYGPPGTGKTHNYKQLIDLIEQKKSEYDIFRILSDNTNTNTSYPQFEQAQEEERVQFVSFHQSYSYEDFIEGFRPIITNEGKSEIKLEDGIFKKLCDEARGKEKNYYMVIDEINRGNIAKIFGELITLIEEDKREGEKGEIKVTLPYSKDEFSIPSNIYIIATMNSSDKSIATIDIALRRRFTFIPMLPNPKLIKNPTAREILEALNTYIGNELGQEYHIGHSYFMNINENDNKRLEFVLKYKISPLLEEYFYIDKAKCEEAKKKINEVYKFFVFEEE